MRRVLVLAVLVVFAAGLAGCVGDEDAPAEPAARSETDEGPVDADASNTGNRTPGPDAVVAFIDMGINPYQAEFRANSSRAHRHPSTYLPGYPEDAQALDLTFDHDSLREAVRADCEEWSQVQPGTLYWVPGTRLVGLVNPVENEEWTEARGFGTDCEAVQGDAWPPLVSGGSHGTGVASRGAGNAYGACSDCLVVSVQGCCPPDEMDRVSAVTWTADQPWVDVQSNSWGLPLDACPEQPRVHRCPTPSFVEAVEEAAARQPSFWATGNGVTTPAVSVTGLVGTPTKQDLRLTPSVVRVGAHDNGQTTLWHGTSPHVVADGCNTWTAEHEQMSGVTPTSFGTSFSTPFAAGIAGKIVLEAREILQDDRTGVRDGVVAEGDPGGIGSGPLADGTFTVEELRRVLYATADPRPEEIEEDGEACDFSPDAEWRQVPEGPAGVPVIGYGAVTPATAEQAGEVLRGEEPMPERPNEDAYFEADRTYRETVHEAYTATGDDTVEVDR